MTTIRWTNRARNDLRAIRTYVARDSRLYARRLTERIKGAVERLARFPESGTTVEEWERTDLREVLEGNYRVIYRYGGRVVEVLAVVHSATRLGDEPAEP
jgi:plasmid stabilization system protein ParE